MIRTLTNRSLCWPVQFTQVILQGGNACMRMSAVVSRTYSRHVP